MVFQNPFLARTPDSSPLSLVAASPKERIFAFFLDLVLLGPIVFFLIHPTLRQGYELLLLGQEKSNLALAVVVIAFWGFMVSYLVQLLCLHVWCGTPGKRMTGLYVLDQNLRRASSGQLSLRTAIWWAQVLFFGVPFLEVLVDASGSSFHDRLAKTKVYSAKGRSWVVAPVEVRFVHMVYAVCISILLLVGTSHLMQVQRHLREKIKAGFVGTNKASACLAEEDTGNSLDESLSAFLTNQISQECLQEKAKASLWKDAGDEFAKLTLGYLETGKQRSAYWDELCQSDQSQGEVCGLKKVMDSSHFEEGAQLSSMTAKILHYFSEKQQGHFGKALEELAQFGGQSFLGDFLAVEGLVLSRLLGREQIYQGLLMALPFSPGDEKSENLFAEMCFQDLHHSCEALSSSACQRVKSTAETEQDHSLLQALAVYKSSECQNLTQESLINMSRSARDPDVIKFLAAAFVLNETHESVSAELKDRAYSDLDFLSRSPLTHWDLRKEAVYVLAKKDPPEAIVKRMSETWMAFTPDLVWFSTAPLILEKLSKNKGTVFSQSQSLVQQRLRELPVKTGKAPHLRQPASERAL